LQVRTSYINTGEASQAYAVEEPLFKEAPHQQNGGESEVEENLVSKENFSQKARRERKDEKKNTATLTKGSARHMARQRREKWKESDPKSALNHGWHTRTEWPSTHLHVPNY